MIAERVEWSADSPASGRLLHFHDVSELVLFGRVSGSFYAEGRRHDLFEGAVVFAPSMRHHDFDLDAGHKDWILVQIDPYVVERLALQPSLTRLNRPFCARPSAMTRARNGLLADWLIEATRDDPLDPLVVRIAELLLTSAVSAPEVGSGEPDQDVDHVDRLLPAIERLRRDPSATIPLEQAAALCSVSPAYFSRRFKQVFGMNFTDYARTYRLHLAARHIATTGAGISEIAYASGFSNPSHFTARFRERFGMAPLQYRRMTRKREVQPPPPEV